MEGQLDHGKGRGRKGGGRRMIGKRDERKINKVMKKGARKKKER